MFVDDTPDYPSRAPLPGVAPSKNIEPLRRSVSPDSDKQLSPRCGYTVRVKSGCLDFGTQPAVSKLHFLNRHLRAQPLTPPPPLRYQRDRLGNVMSPKRYIEIMNGLQWSTRPLSPVRTGSQPKSSSRMSPTKFQHHHHGCPAHGLGAREGMPRGHHLHHPHHTLEWHNGSTTPLARHRWGLPHGHTRELSL